MSYGITILVSVCIGLMGRMFQSHPRNAPVQLLKTCEEIIEK